MPTAKSRAHAADDSDAPTPDLYVCGWPDDEFVTGIDGIVITRDGTAIPDASFDAVMKAAADNHVTLVKVS